MLYEADEFVFKWMEENVKDFPQSDFQKVQAKLRQLDGQALKAAVKAASNAQSGVVGREAFVRAVKSVAGAALSTHEIITVARRCAQDDKNVDTSKFLAEL